MFTAFKLDKNNNYRSYKMQFFSQFSRETMPKQLKIHVASDNLVRMHCS